MLAAVLLCSMQVGVRAEDAPKTTTSLAASPPSLPQLLNISTRMRVLQADKVLIAGFIITGSDQKKLIIRGLGPSLSNSGVQGALADPVLELHNSAGNLVATNNNWKDTQQTEIEATTIPPTNDLESAIVTTLPPGTYTAILRGRNTGEFGVPGNAPDPTGIGLVEVYDLAQSAHSTLANISTRGFVDTGDNVMIGGLIVGGGNTGGTDKSVVRAIGPSLSAAGVSGALQDPTLELHDANGTTIAFNDNWKDSQQSEIQATGIPPNDDRESAIVATLSAGNYTAVVRGKNNSTGIGLVEVYNLTLNWPVPIITTVAGSGRPLFGAGGPATDVNLGDVHGVAVDTAGNVYVSDWSHQMVFKITPTGTLTVVAGTGTAGFSGDGGQAKDAQLQRPGPLAFDSVGNLYIADGVNFRVRKVTLAGIITTVAGNGGNSAVPNDGDPATSGNICEPSGLAIDSNDNIYIGSSCAYVWKVLPNGTIFRAAGIGVNGDSGEGGPATSAKLNPSGLAIGSDGKLYIACFVNRRVLVITTDGNIHAFAGTGVLGCEGDNGPALNATFAQPNQVAVDKDDNVYITDSNCSTVRKVNGSGVISRFAGNNTGQGFSGDGGPATDAQLNAPVGVAIDSGGNMYVADTGNQRVRKINSSGTISTFAGNGATNFFGDSGPATSAGLDRPQAAVVDTAGNLYIADTFNQRVRKVASDGTITTFAGKGTPGFGGDNGPATAAMLNMPNSVALDSAGNVYVTDSLNFRVRKIDTHGTITTFAGNGQAGCCGITQIGDGGLAVNARLGIGVQGLAIDAADNVYIADGQNYRVRKVDANGIITTVAGNGQDGSTGDNGPATDAALSPAWLSFDNAGNLYISDWDHWHVRKVDSNGIITNFVGDGHGGDPGTRGCMCLDYPGILITQVSVESPMLVPDGAGDFYLVATGFNQIAKVFADGTFAYVDSALTFGVFQGFGGDGGPAISAPLNSPYSLTLDAAGDLYIADTGNDRIRKVWFHGYPSPTPSPTP
jgi:NHL repeat